MKSLQPFETFRYFWCFLAEHQMLSVQVFKRRDDQDLCVILQARVSQVGFKKANCTLTHTYVVSTFTPYAKHMATSSGDPRSTAIVKPAGVNCRIVATIRVGQMHTNSLGLTWDEFVLSKSSSDVAFASANSSARDLSNDCLIVASKLNFCSSCTFRRRARFRHLESLTSISYCLTARARVTSHCSLGSEVLFIQWSG